MSDVPQELRHRYARPQIEPLLDELLDLNNQIEALRAELAREQLALIASKKGPARERVPFTKGENILQTACTAIASFVAAFLASIHARGLL